MLYNGHVVIVETFLRNQPNHGQTLIEKPLNSGHFYSGHFGQNLPLISGHLYDWLRKKKTHACFYLTHFFTLT